jgi:ABC-type phosphate transport system substrate-binding protein
MFVKGLFLLMRSSVLQTAGSGRLRFAAAAMATTGLLALAAGLPSAASAAFDASAPSCLPAALGGEGGSSSAVSIQGEGSSLQANAQNLWKTILKTEAHGCGSNAPSVTFESKSSGCGLNAVGAGSEASSCTFKTGAGEAGSKPGYRDIKDRFGASDFAPSPEEEQNIDAGPNGAGNAKSGSIHVIPVAEAAIAVVVNFPEGCKLKSPGTGAMSENNDASTGGPNDLSAAPTGDTEANETLRVHIPAQALEEIWEHKITQWGKIPTPTGNKLLEDEMTGMPTGQDATDSCASAPIYRIVREDVSGTSFNFKAYLSLLPSIEGGPALWSESEVGKKNQAWPLASASSPGVPVAVNKTTNVCEEATNQICRAAASGGGGLAKAVNATDGSIGYLDLATARKEGFNMEEKAADDRYWLPLEPVSPTATPGVVDTGVFVEPTVDSGAHFTKLEGHRKGANCEGADVRGVPAAGESPNGDPTLGNWSKAIATGGTSKAIAEHPTTAYPVCAITYDLAFDDNAAAYENTTPEEQAARAIKDYLSVAVSQFGQDQLPGEADYAVLEPELLTDAQTGVAAIGWNKTSGAGGKTEEVVKPPVVVAKTGTTAPGVTPVAPPSNSFSVASAKVKGKNIVLSLVLPGAGKVQIKAAGGGVTVSNVTASVSGGQGTVTLPISSAALKKLAKAKSKKLSVSITVTFTPTGGTAATQTKTLTITQASIAGKPKKKSKKKGKKG